MRRTAVPAALLLALAGPAAAQQPAPALPTRPAPAPAPAPGGAPGQPVPPAPLVEFAVPAQPGGPGQPAVIFSNTGRVAPGNSGPRLVVARVADGALVYSATDMVPVNQQMDVVVNENGNTVTRRINTTAMQPTTRDVSVPLDGVKIRDAAGKRVQPLSLEIRLGKGTGVVLHTGPIADPIRAMFKDDTLFVELPNGGGPPQMLPAGGFAAPPFIAPPGVQPLPAAGGGPAPAAPDRATTRPAAPPTAPAPRRE